MFVFPPKIDLDHFGIALHIIHGAFAKNGSLVKDGHFSSGRDLPHEHHIVLDHNDRVMTRERKEQLPGAMGLLIGHPSGGFIHEEKLRVLGEQHSDFKPLLLPVRQRSGFRFRLCVQIDGLENAMNAVAFSTVWTMKQAVPNPAAPFRAQQQILKDTVIRINRRSLEFAPDAETINLYSFI